MSDEFLFECFSKLGIKCSLVKKNAEFELITFNVWAKPGSKIEKIDLSLEGEIVIHTRQKPVEGRANKDIAQSIAKLFGVSKSHVEIDKGEKSKHKQVLVCFYFTKDKTLSYYLEVLQKNFGKK